MSEQTPEEKLETAAKIAEVKVAASAVEAANKVAVASAQASFDTILVESLRDIRSSVGRVEDKTDRMGERMDILGSRMDTLVMTTNHRLDDFWGTQSILSTELRGAIAKKVDKTDLLSSVGFKLANIKVVRWGLGAAFASAVSTVAVQHWWGEILGLLR